MSQLVSTSGVDRNSASYVLKEIMDRTVGLVLLVMASPLLLFLAVLIKLSSKGPALFVSQRAGLDGEPFAVYKFRSMHVDGDRILSAYLARNSEVRQEWDTFHKLRGFDPRVFPVGRLLRKLSLDELPQLINVVLGQMSLVGPRPYLLSELSQMGEYRSRILSVRPGITGLWQVSGRNELTFDERVVLEAEYVENWSFAGDLLLLWRTIFVVLGARGAY